jgi:hypothetical protein
MLTADCTEEMRTSTNEAFLLLEGWQKETKTLYVVAALKEGTSPGHRFRALISKVSRLPETVVLLAETPTSAEEVSIDLKGCLFDYFEPGAPGVIVEPESEKWQCFLKADLKNGGMIIFSVLR